jgi:hypothetical protein
MKSKLLITLLSLMTASAYAEPSIPVGGISPLINRPDVTREVAPSMPQPSLLRPVPQMNNGVPLPGGPHPQVGATGDEGVTKQVAAPVAVKPTPTQPKPAEVVIYGLTNDSGVAEPAGLDPH